MQNEHGLIKIGHSVDPEQRRRVLEIEERCKIALVFTLPEKGSREQAVHLKVKDYGLVGEWFEGTEEARASILKAVKRGLSLNWPYELDEVAAEVWLDEFTERRVTRYESRRIDECFRRVRRNATGWLADADIWEILMLLEGNFVGIIVGEENGQTVLDGLVSDSDASIRIPEYSVELEAAMSLWLEGNRPLSWEGTALECCLAALKQRRDKLKIRASLEN